MSERPVSMERISAKRDSLMGKLAATRQEIGTLTGMISSGLNRQPSLALDLVQTAIGRRIAGRANLASIIEKWADRLSDVPLAQEHIATIQGRQQAIDRRLTEQQATREELKVVKGSLRPVEYRKAQDSLAQAEIESLGDRLKLQEAEQAARGAADLSMRTVMPMFIPGAISVFSSVLPEIPTKAEPERVDVVFKPLVEIKVVPTKVGGIAVNGKNLKQAISTDCLAYVIQAYQSGRGVLVAELEALFPPDSDLAKVRAHHLGVYVKRICNFLRGLGVEADIRKQGGKNVSIIFPEIERFRERFGAEASSAELAPQGQEVLVQAPDTRGQKKNKGTRSR